MCRNEWFKTDEERFTTLRFNELIFSNIINKESNTINVILHSFKLMKQIKYLQFITKTENQFSDF